MQDRYLGTLARVSVGRIRSDWSRSAAKDRDLSFWSDDTPLFVTAAGKPIPAESNCPTAWLDVFQAPGILAVDYAAYPARSPRQNIALEKDLGDATRRTRQLLSAFFRRAVTTDRELCADLAAGIISIGSGLVDDAPKFPPGHRWDRSYSHSGVWDASTLRRRPDGAVLVEISQAAGLSYTRSEGRIADWAGLEEADAVMRDMPVHTAIAWPRLR
jgi:hypothetical protein